MLGPLLSALLYSLSASIPYFGGAILVSIALSALFLPALTKDEEGERFLNHKVVYSRPAGADSLRSAIAEMHGVDTDAVQVDCFDAPPHFRLGFAAVTDRFPEALGRLGELVRSWSIAHLRGLA
jgi:hypothetical protein